jgi:HlyD family secretion protein
MHSVGAIEVKFSLLQQPAPDFLREDMTLSIEVETARRESVLVVPAACIAGVVFIGIRCNGND